MAQACNACMLLGIHKEGGVETCCHSDRNSWYNYAHYILIWERSHLKCNFAFLYQCIVFHSLRLQGGRSYILPSLSPISSTAYCYFQCSAHMGNWLNWFSSVLNMQHDTYGIHLRSCMKSLSEQQRYIIKPKYV